MNMTKNYVIKRNPDFANHGVLIKKNSKNKLYSETLISDRAGDPCSKKLKEGDTIFVAETKYGIFAKGKVIRMGAIEKCDSIEEVLGLIKKSQNKDCAYWMDKLKRFNEKKNGHINCSLKYQEYFVDQELLDRTIPLIDKLTRIGAPGVANSIICLSDDEINYINKPIYRKVEELQTSIPAHLRMDIIYTLLNEKYYVQHWIDIDHFVPKSTSGPGNIIENLVPVNFSLNRHKGNSVPKCLFEIAKDDKYSDLRDFVPNDFINAKDEFLTKKKYKNVIDSARKINEHIMKNYDIEKAKSFYKRVLEKKHPDYVKIIESLNKSLN
ncbi:MAG: HNH endonuclease domain-containing protein [Desulfobacterales bacterium]